MFFADVQVLYSRLELVAVADLIRSFEFCSRVQMQHCPVFLGGSK